jgi:HNH endonuclease
VTENLRVASVSSIAAFFGISPGEVRAILGDSQTGSAGLFSCQALWLRLVSGNLEGLSDLESRLDVMRRRGSARLYKTKKNRAAVLARDGKACSYCQRDRRRLEIDHVVPVASGGSSEESNLVPACYDCNTEKGSYHPSQWIERLVSQAAVCRGEKQQARLLSKAENVQAVCRRLNIPVAAVSDCLPERFKLRRNTHAAHYL